MRVKEFLKESVAQIPHEKVMVSDRFRDDAGQAIPFELRALSQKEITVIEESAIIRRVGKNGEAEVRFEDLDYSVGLIAASCVVPNFRDPALQENWGARDEKDLVRKMLLAGEFHRLDQAVKKICGFGYRLGAMKNQVKK
ncbi:MAG TPA: hypothetical protein H9671_07505 [Firmicutes bacterium]|nr:hypothetical protein [Bacillota bacterium]